MKKPIVKNLALFVTLIQIFATSHAKAENSPRHSIFYIDRHGQLAVTDEKSVLDNNGKTYVEEGDTISIYSKKNTTSRQFGGSQKVFDKNFDLLIQEPYYWNLLQQWFPVNKFPTEDFAMRFYKHFSNDIANKGCGYVSFANEVFRAYEDGNEDLFEEIYGFPMYRIYEEDKAIDYNYEYFILGQFIYHNSYPNYDEKKLDAIAHMFDKTITKEYLDEFLSSQEHIKFKVLSQREFFALSEEEQIEYANKLQEITTKEEELFKNYESAHDNPNLTFGIDEEHGLGHIREYLASFGVSVGINVKNFNIKGTKFTDFQPGDIIVFEGLVLYKYDGQYDEKYSIARYGVNNKDGVEKIVAHSVNVVSVDNGKVIVSNLGDRFIVDQEQSTPSIRIRINVKVNDKKK